MPELGHSSNNQLPPPSSQIASTASVTLSAEPYTRNTKFYYSDGSAVFLVENELFKFQASLLAADVKDYKFKYIMKDTINGFGGGGDKPGTSDAHPIVLPADITASQFRDFLMVVFGGVTDNTIIAFLKDLQTPSSYTPLLMSRLTNIGYLGCQFGIKRVDTWSQLRILELLKTFMTTRRVVDDWDAQVILRLVQYVQNTIVPDYRSQLLYLMRHIISTLVKKAYELDNETPQGKIIEVCAALYKEKNTLVNSPGFFGFIFAIIISLGHQSPIWADYLTQEDRRVLWVANLTLTRLGNQADLDLGWVLDPSEVKEVCSQCSDVFDDYWSGSFSQCKGFESRLPSEDMRHVIALPEYIMQFWSLGKTNPCRCAGKVLDKVEVRLESLYCILAEKYKVLAEAA